MKKFLLLCLVFFASAQLVSAQTPYTSAPDEKHPEVTILNGIISKYILLNNDAFKWYGSAQSSYTPDAELVNALEASKGKVQFIIFGGTWCEDTQYVLPKFFKWQEMSGFPDEAISFFGVNRAKKTLGHLADAFNITNVPTIIVMKDGKEVGRVVEYGKTGKWDKEVAELLK
ncbi:MAG TPA: thioredoxin family protein [Ferruginibacter sp.]|nr:thioredoxin family protein [Ferruginibacter sp.]